ncbi:MAG: hypothetical protein JO129_04240 [Candidatus Dependentiae bacterium]|nr:hypothetical protein [Candidatus Dependentiae bacterium]
MIENKDQLIDIYDIWYEPSWQVEWIYTILKIGTCLLIAYFLYYFYKKYIRKVTVVDCAIIAYRDLDALQKFPMITAQDSKDCYFSLSSIIKKYLACRYHDTFIQLTDKEIISQAERYMSGDNVRILQKILQGMTFIKFEHEVVASEKLEKDIQTIKEFIEYTTVQHNSKEV